MRGNEQEERHVGLDSPQNSPRGNPNDLRPIDGSKPVVTVQLRKAGDFEVSSNRSTPLHPTQATANPMLK